MAFQTFQAEKQLNVFPGEFQWDEKLIHLPTSTYVKLDWILETLEQPAIQWYIKCI